ncbi:unnamed protein product, partial [Didymodactylos carnosus]
MVKSHAAETSYGVVVEEIQQRINGPLFGNQQLLSLSLHTPDDINHEYIYRLILPYIDDQMVVSSVEETASISQTISSTEVLTVQDFPVENDTTRLIGAI